MVEKLVVRPSFGTENLQDIGDDAEVWKEKFITTKIECRRSMKSPDGTEGSGPQESRLHAFYRIIGFPIGTAKGFYNPGHNPLVDAKTDKNIIKINNDVNTSGSLKDQILQRERDPINLRKIFSRQSVASILYATALRYPRQFQVLSESTGPFDKDIKTFEVKEREQNFLHFFTVNGFPATETGLMMDFFKTTPVGLTTQSYRHILRPFLVDPDISSGVNPAQHLVCVPFLQNTASATRIGLQPDDDLPRPELEKIIAARLSDKQLSKEFLQNVKNILQKEKSTTTAITDSPADLRSTIIALADKDEIDSSDIDAVYGNFRSVQSIQVSYFIKLIRAAVKKLHQSMADVDKIRETFNWAPIPDPAGPEFVTRQSTMEQNHILSTSKLDKTIDDLKRKTYEAAARANDVVSLSSSDGSVPRYVFDDVKTTEKDNDDDFEQQLKSLEESRKKLSMMAFKALRDIEIISGEVSGLGLIDIFAISAALWAMDEEFLLGFLDDSAFNRMVVFRGDDLKSDIIDIRLITGSKPSLEDCLKNFEKKLINILNFADKEFHRQLESPIEKPVGSPQ